MLIKGHDERTKTFYLLVLLNTRLPKLPVFEQNETVFAIGVMRTKNNRELSIGIM